MSEEDIKKAFLRFIKEKGAYSGYVRNIKKNKKTIEGVIKYSGVQNLIQGAFVWMGTPEGHSYWSYLSDEWAKCRMQSEITPEIIEPSYD